MRGIMKSRPAILLAALVVSLPLLCMAQSNTLTLDEILSRMDQARSAQRDRSLPYTVIREYNLASEQNQTTSNVVAQVNVVPPTQQDYEIVKADGNDRGESVVRRILDHQAKMASQWRAHQIDSSNYSFALLGRDTVDGHPCYLLQITPKREAVELVQGKAWVDAQNFMVRRVEGTTAKTPSIWIKKLNVTVNSGEVNGVWLETSTRAVAEVRLLGPHVLTSHELDVHPAVYDAQARTPVRAHARRTKGHSVADTATWMAR